MPFLDKVFMPAVVSGADGQTAQKTVHFLQLRFNACRRHPGHGAQADSHGPAVQQTMVFPQLHFLYEVVDVPVALVVNIPCRGAEADSHGPDCSSDHR